MITYLNEFLGNQLLKPLFSNNTQKSFQLTDEIKEVLKDGVANLNGSIRRMFMAKTVIALGKGGQSKAEKELKWNRNTLRKGMFEVKRGIVCVDNITARGRKPIETKLPKLSEDIKAIVKPTTQADPTFRTTKLYTPLTAESVRKILIEEKNYEDNELPSARTISTKLNDLNFNPQKVAKCKPVKKIKETDEIFEQIHKINKEADATEGVLRISIDAKAKVEVGQFSRGGKSRQGEKGADHDFAPEEILTPFGFYLPAYDDLFYYYTKSLVTADFILDCLENLWPLIKKRFNPHILVINSDNCPETNSHRTQFIKRIVDFAHEQSITIRLAYYPPYHSKYNPIERTWGILEKHWNGEILYSTDKVIGLTKTMSWNGKNPNVQLVEGDYQKGVKLKKNEMLIYEKMINRLPGLEKWFVDIPPNFN